MTKRYITRDIEAIIRKAERQFPAIIVTGPRQSGKTTLLKHLFLKTHNYVSLDDPDNRLMANREPRFFMENFPAPVIIDEIQYAPELFSYIKMVVDKDRSKKGQFLLTGSQSFPLMAKVTESLAGRIAIFNLLPFSFKERLKMQKSFSLDVFKKMLLRGGFPELVVNKSMDAKLWFNGYLQTYLERDVRQLRNIGNLTDFQRFLEMLASYNGQVLNLSDLSRNLGVAVNTIKGWISILEACNQIALIKPYYKNKGKRLIKRPKIYFLDTGFLCYLNGMTDQNQVLKGPAAGQLFEGAVLTEIIHGFYDKGDIPRVFWWRTSHGEEVDFIVEKKGRLVPIEVKITSRSNKVLTQGLVAFERLFSTEVKKSIVVNLSDKKLLVSNKIECQPFRDFIESF